MKITFVCPVVSQRGGFRVVAIYAEKLRKLGHDVKVVSRAPIKAKGLRGWVKRLRNPKAMAPRPDRTKYFDPLGDRHIQIAHDGPLLPDDVPDADVIVATWWRTAFEVATLPAEKGRKVYFVQHHEIHDFLPWDLSAGSYYLPLKKITISQWLVNILANVYGDKDVPKVANSVDTDQFNAPPRQKNSNPTVGLMYSNASYKGVDISLAAIELAKKSVPNLKVVSFGTGEPRPESPLPEGSHYRKSPPQNEIKDIYAACDLWLVASRAEGFGLPLLEAMACRTPVIATKTGAAEDVISEGENGHLVEIDDVETLARRIVDVANLSPNSWKKMSDTAYERVENYSWDDATRAFEAELEKVRTDTV